MGSGVPLGPRADSGHSGHAASCAGMAFSPSAGGRGMAEQGLLGRMMSFCEEASGGGGGASMGEPLSPWAREGGYGRAPGFEREDQVRDALVLD